MPAGGEARPGRGGGGVGGRGYLAGVSRLFEGVVNFRTIKRKEKNPLVAHSFTTVERTR